MQLHVVPPSSTETKLELPARGYEMLAQSYFPCWVSQAMVISMLFWLLHEML